MLIARVVGDITATCKHPTHEGKKILLVQPLDLDGSDRGNPVVAVDSVNAGAGDRVLLVQDGFAAFTCVGHKSAPLDAAVIGVIDQIELVSDVLGRTAAPAAPVAAPAAPAPAKKQNKKKNS